MGQRDRTTCKQVSATDHFKAAKGWRKLSLGTARRTEQNALKTEAPPPGPPCPSGSVKSSGVALAAKPTSHHSSYSSFCRPSTTSGPAPHVPESPARASRAPARAGAAPWRLSSRAGHTAPPPSAPVSSLSEDLQGQAGGDAGPWRAACS